MVPLASITHAHRQSLGQHSRHCEAPRQIYALSLALHRSDSRFHHRWGLRTDSHAGGRWLESSIDHHPQARGGSRLTLRLSVVAGAPGPSARVDQDGGVGACAPAPPMSNDATPRADCRGGPRSEPGRVPRVGGGRRPIGLGS
jgi:hypothetical protein